MKIIAALLLIACGSACAAKFPEPPGASAGKGTETAVLAGGCFWGTEAVFERLKGVTAAEAGYSGGDRTTAHYEDVSTGQTGHAESVRIRYDASQISFGQILKIFFAVAHDPTQLDRQGNDVGPQYRSSIFYVNAEQKAIAEAYIRELNEAGVYPAPIVTKVVPLAAFYPAEGYHQKFVDRNPTQPYVVAVELPKLENLRETYPEMVRK